MNAFDAAEKNGRAAALQKWTYSPAKNKSPSKDTTSILAAYLRVTVLV